MTVYLLAAISVDGFIAPDTDVNSTTWMSQSYRDWFESRTRDMGVVIMSSATYTSLRNPLQDRLNIVLITAGSVDENIPDQDENDTKVVFTRKSPSALITELDQKGYSEGAIFGSQSIFTQFINAGLIDTIQLGVESRFFGRGAGLFNSRITRTIALTAVERLSTETVLLTYDVR